MEEPHLSRQELRAILANPESTQEQVLQVRLLLARRIVNGTNKVRTICDRYEKLVVSHQSRFGELESWAENQMQANEMALVERDGE